MKDTYTLIASEGRYYIEHFDRENHKIFTQVSRYDFVDIAKLLTKPECTDELVMNTIGEAQI